MNLFITGGTGFIGAALCDHLLRRGHQLTVLSRDLAVARERLGSAVELVSEPAAVADCPYDGLINLAGLPIANRPWTPARKEALRASRVTLTNQLVEALGKASQRPRVMISASAVGYYGDQGERWVDENSVPRVEFTHELCHAWEQAALSAQLLGIRVCVLRLGLVVGAGGGFLQRMVPPFSFGLGGRLGSGRQWMSWVHREDVLHMMRYLLEHDTLRGAFNATSPRPVRNDEFTRTLARQLRRPARLPVPSAVLQLAMGEMSRLLLTGQRVAPSRLLDAGFEFNYEDLAGALSEVLA